MVVADEDERAGLVTVESDRSVDQVDPNLQFVLELSTENKNITLPVGLDKNTFQHQPGTTHSCGLRRGDSPARDTRGYQ